MLVLAQIERVETEEAIEPRLGQCSEAMADLQTDSNSETDRHDLLQQTEHGHSYSTKVCVPALTLTVILKGHTTAQEASRKAMMGSAEGSGSIHSTEKMRVRTGVHAAHSITHPSASLFRKRIQAWHPGITAAAAHQTQHRLGRQVSSQIECTHGQSRADCAYRIGCHQIGSVGFTLRVRAGVVDNLTRGVARWR